MPTASARTHMADSPPAGPDRAATGTLASAAPRGRSRARRNWGYVAAGLGLMLLTAVLFATAWAAGRETTPVLALARTVHRGAVITADDLTVAHAVADPAIVEIPASEVTTVVGMRAALDLPAGSLLNPAAISDELVPQPGESLVGLHLSPAQLPHAELRPGDRVTVVDAGREGEAVTGDTQTVPAVVVGAGVADDGARVVDVTVASQDAAAVAAWVATGRAAVYLESAAG